MYTLIILTISLGWPTEDNAPIEWPAKTVRCDHRREVSTPISGSDNIITVWQQLSSFEFGGRYCTESVASQK